MELLGIDISLYQGDIDLKKAKAEGVKFVIIKCSENNFTDPKLDRNVKAAKEAGLPFGFYHYLRAKTVDGVKSEAQTAIKAIEKYKPFDYPVFVDTEDPSYDGYSKDTITNLVSTFCNVIENAGYWAGFYTNLDWYRNRLNGAKLAARYSMWLACWGSEKPSVDGVQMWQFGGEYNPKRSNIIAGVVCDQDYCYFDYPKEVKAHGVNGYKKQTANTTPAAKPTSTPAPKPAPKPTPKPSTTELKPGDEFRLKSDAVVYGSTERFYPFVYNVPLYVLEVQANNRIVFSTSKGGGVTGAVDRKYIQKV